MTQCRKWLLSLSQWCTKTLIKHILTFVMEILTIKKIKQFPNCYIVFTRCELQKIIWLNAWKIIIYNTNHGWHVLNSTLVTMTFASEGAILIKWTNVSTKVIFSNKYKPNLSTSRCSKGFLTWSRSSSRNLNYNFTNNCIEPKLDLNYESASCWT
jgi:hypothetical protein